MFCHSFPGFSHIRFPHRKSTHPPLPPQVDQQRYPVLLTEPPYNPTAKREKMVEVSPVMVSVVNDTNIGGAPKTK